MTKLATFPALSFTGYPPTFTSVIQANDGDLYGTTTTGGANGTGTIYKLTLGGQYTLLYTFPKGIDYTPMQMIEGSDGNLYGATYAGSGYGASQIFRLTRSGQYTLLFALSNAVTEGSCLCLLTQGSDGIIYGTAQGGGTSGGGDIFALDAGLPKPAPRAQHFHPQTGAAGTRVRIWGQNLLAATVQFNGVSALTAASSGANYVWATVPSGATTGPITLTTPGGAATTKASFTVQ